MVKFYDEEVSQFTATHLDDLRSLDAQMILPPLCLELRSLDIHWSHVGWAKCRPMCLLSTWNLHNILPTINGEDNGMVSNASLLPTLLGFYRSCEIIILYLAKNVMMPETSHY